MSKLALITILSAIMTLSYAGKIPQDGGEKGEIKTDNIIGSPAINPEDSSGNNSIQDSVKEENKMLEQDAKKANQSIQNKVNTDTEALSKPQL